MADPGPRQVDHGQPVEPSPGQQARERRRLEAAAERARQERDIAEWRYRRVRDRRAWRMLEAFLTAIRLPRRWLALPLMLLRIATDRREPQPPPAALAIRKEEAARPSPAAAVRRARSALELAQHTEALAAAEEALEIDPSDVRALDVAWRVHEALGDITPALRVVRRQRAVQDRSWLGAAERRLQGELIALDPQWVPSVAPFAGRADGPVLLIEGDEVEAESVTGSQATPLVSVSAHRQLNEVYALDDLPLDSATQDLAWWAARAARAHRPRAVAAPLTADLRPTIAALAIARAGRIPLHLIDAGVDEVPGPADSERARRCRDRAAHLRADAAVVAEDVTGAVDAVDAIGGEGAR